MKRRRQDLGAQQGAGAPLPAPRMAGAANFCSQCGQKVEATFKFCPCCGIRLPVQEEEPMQISPAPSTKELSSKLPKEDKNELPRSPKIRIIVSEPDKAPAVASIKQDVPGKSTVAATSPKDKAKLGPRSPRKDRCAPVAPLPEGMLLTDMNNKQWKLVKLLSQTDCGLLYEANSVCEASSQKKKYSLRLAAKEGKLFNEQNCLLRAAKKATVEKWKKQFSIPFLGIPTCIGFGLHCDYRFLVFSDLGCSLQSILDDNAKKLTEKATLQIGIRLLDALEYLHGNDYTHGNVTTENVYVNPDDLTEVTLANYYFAFRYCPEGNHVPLRNGSRTPHEGTLEFISLDSHKGTAPSRRSDLESLGYCLLKWLCGPVLPWSEELTDSHAVMEKKERFKADLFKDPKLLPFGNTIPAALMKYLEQVLSLEYDEKPNYEGLRTYLTEPLDKMRAFAYDPVDLKAVS